MVIIKDIPSILALRAMGRKNKVLRPLNGANMKYHSYARLPALTFNSFCIYKISAKSAFYRVTWPFVN